VIYSRIYNWVYSRIVWKSASSSCEESIAILFNYNYCTIPQSIFLTALNEFDLFYQTVRINSINRIVRGINEWINPAS